jgi:DNA-binding response OmpR family regulator
VTNAKVLLLCDDPDIGKYWTHWLGLSDIEVAPVASAREASEQWSREPRDLIIIDLYRNLSEEIRSCVQLTGQVANLILLYTYRSQEPEILQAYDAGVDDCVTKPLSNFVLLAKVRAWLRHSWNVPASALEPIQVGNFRLEPRERRVVTPDESIVHLTNLEFRLFYLLLSLEQIYKLRLESVP